MKKLISIIIPTFNNQEYLDPCVTAIISSGILNGFAELIIVNNGSQPIQERFGHIPNVKVLKPKENLGWEGGLKLGLKESDSEYVVFQNDDTQLIPAQPNFYERLLINFHDPKVAAVGPSTTVAAGWHSIFRPGNPITSAQVTYLIFFTVMVKRSILEEVGGVDDTLPGGDDIDLSIRFRKAGYKCIVDPGAFIIHHGFKTGERVHGGANQHMGWNSLQMTERTNHALIKKHGFRWFIETIRGVQKLDKKAPQKDLEEELVRTYLNGHKNVLELGCGPKKILPESIGIDLAPKGEKIREHDGRVSVADIVGDVSKPLEVEGERDAIIAQHVLEHCIDTVGCIKNWSSKLRKGGRLILAVPDENVTSGIPLNPEHCHAFTQESLKNIVEACGLKEVESKPSGNGISFVGCYEKC